MISERLFNTDWTRFRNFSFYYIYSLVSVIILLWCQIYLVNFFSLPVVEGEYKYVDNSTLSVIYIYNNTQFIHYCTYQQGFDTTKNIILGTDLLPLCPRGEMIHGSISIFCLMISIILLCLNVILFYDVLKCFQIKFYSIKKINKSERKMFNHLQ